jgi:uncharacterized membrane protein YtjA (UPF0391 family)
LATRRRVTFPLELQDSLYRHTASSSTTLRLYSTDAPIEQVLVHWENRHLLSSFLTLRFTERQFSKYSLDRIRFLSPAHYISCRESIKGGFMLYWTLVFLVIALIAGVLGFTGVAVAAAGVSKLLFVVFLILFVISLASHLGRRRV